MNRFDESSQAHYDLENTVMMVLGVIDFMQKRFAKEWIENNRDRLKRNGSLIIELPRLTIVSACSGVYWVAPETEIFLWGGLLFI